MQYLWTAFELIVTLVEQLIAMHFVCAFLRYDFSTRKSKLVYVLGSIVGAGIVSMVNYFTPYEGWLGIIYPIYWFLFSLFFVEGTVFQKVVASLISNIVVISVSSIVTNSVSFLLKSDIESIYLQNGLNRFLTIILVQFVLLYAYSIILKILNKTLLTLKTREWILIATVFTVSSFSLAMIHMAAYYADFSSQFPGILLSEIGLVSINLICLYMTLALSKSNKATEEMKLKEQQKEYSIQYAQTIQKQYEEIRSMRHDMKQHYTVIYQLQNEKKYDLSAEYIELCLDKIKSVELFMDVGNDFVNAILNSKLSVAKTIGIEVLCSSSSNISGINDYDVCILLGNMLDNAIEGASKTITGSFIDVSISSDNFKLIICVSNSIPKSVLEYNGDLKSSKEESEQHGYGVKTIRKLAKQYNGYADFYEEGMVFNCRVVMYK